MNTNLKWMTEGFFIRGRFAFIRGPPSFNAGRFRLEKFGVAKHPGGEHLAFVGSTDDVFWNRSPGFSPSCVPHVADDRSLTPVPMIPSRVACRDSLFHLLFF
jgi:hypothetical protein